MYWIKKVLAWLSRGNKATTILGVISSLITIITLFLPNEIRVLISEKPPLLRWIFLFILLVIVASCVFAKRLMRHTFQYGSEKFINFFTNWYSQGGIISIVCDDLDWTAQGEETSIYNELCKKAQNKELRLYLGNKNDGLARALKRLGAEVNVRPDSVSDYAFSCVEIMGNRTNKMIVRDKQNDINGMVVFEERENDKFLKTLLETVVEYANAKENSKKR